MEMTKVNSVQDLIVWQRSFDLAEELYELTSRFPREELYGLTSQIRRASVSIPANIAEGYARFSRKDYARFIAIALGSAREVETLILFAIRVKVTSREDAKRSLELVDECCRMLSSIRRKLAV